jgi:hypothetical protein
LRNDVFNHAPQRVEAGPDQVFPNGLPHQIPPPGMTGAERLRRLASHYVHHPDAQVDMVHMQPGQGDRFVVVITLEMSGFPDMTGAEMLRRLASHYVRHPDAQVDMVHMQPGQGDRFVMVITVEMSSFL